WDVLREVLNDLPRFVPDLRENRNMCRIKIAVRIVAGFELCERNLDHQDIGVPVLRFAQLQDARLKLQIIRQSRLGEHVEQRCLERLNGKFRLWRKGEIPGARFEIESTTR